MSLTIDLTPMSFARPIREETLLIGSLIVWVNEYTDTQFRFRVSLAKDVFSTVRTDPVRFGEVIAEYLTDNFGEQTEETWYQPRNTWYWFLNSPEATDKFIAYLSPAQLLTKLSS